MHPLKTGLEEGVPIQAYMQIHADTCRYRRIWTPLKIHTRYTQDMHIHTDMHTIKRPKIDMHATKPLCELYVSACILYVSTIYLVHICMFRVHICMYCLYLYVSMRLATFAAKNTDRYIQYIQICTRYIQDMHWIYTWYSKDTGRIYQFISYVSYLYVSVCIMYVYLLRIYIFEKGYKPI